MKSILFFRIWGTIGNLFKPATMGKDGKWVSEKEGPGDKVEPIEGLLGV